MICKHEPFRAENMGLSFPVFCKYDELVSFHDKGASLDIP